MFLTSSVFFCLLFSCSLADRENRTEYPVTEPVMGEEIIVKVHSPVPLSQIDMFVPGTRIRTVTRLNDYTYVLYRLSDKADSQSVLMSLMAGGIVAAAEVNATYTLFLFKPDDPYYGQYQYAPRITGCESGWEIETGSSSITVAVLDTGINGEHEDITGRVIAGRNIGAGADIPPGANSDDLGHGTFVSGIIGAAGNNGKGIAGVAWHINLMPVKIIAEGVNTTAAHIVEGLVWAVDHGADVVNMSFGGSIYSIAINDAVNYALEENVVLVAAMGNDSKKMMKYPAAMPGIMAIGSTNGRDEVSYFSTRGNHMSVAAPGESIYSCRHSSATEYFFASGTSASAPFVSGLAALLLSGNPGLSPGQVRSMIEDSADPLGPDDFSLDYGYGRVNVYHALTIPVVNNYGSIKVIVSNRGKYIGGVKVLIEDTLDSTIIQSGLTSFGGDNGGENGRIVFNHIRLGTYRVRVHIGESRVQEVTLPSPGESVEVFFDFDTSLVLLINGIKVMDNSLFTDEFLYMQKLTDMGRYFSIWKTAFNGPPPGELLYAYDMVVWFTGRTRSEPDNNIEVLSEQETGVIEEYLDNGGLLYLCGNNIAEYLSQANPSFLTNYLHAQYLTSPLSHDELNGRGFLDMMYVIINMEDDDQIGLEPGATGILDSSDELEENHWAGLSWNTGYRLVFTTLTSNEILYCEPDMFFQDIITWLDSGS